jgi:threonine/homoserine/homoserine lactone efflux protein
VDLSLLLKGGLIGISIAAPVGPIGVLCIRRTLADGSRAGLVSGLGAATADALYGCIAGFGLTAISSVLVTQRSLLSLVGGLFLLYLGIKTLLTKPTQDAALIKGRSLLGMYASTYMLTLTNPMTILSFVAIFAGLGLDDATGNYVSAAMLVLGVFIGSALWWLMLSAVVSVLRARFSVAGMRWVNLASGLIITSFGLFALVSLILH